MSLHPTQPGSGPARIRLRYLAEFHDVPLLPRCEHCSKVQIEVNDACPACGRTTFRDYIGISFPSDAWWLATSLIWFNKHFRKRGDSWYARRLPNGRLVCLTHDWRLLLKTRGAWNDGLENP